MKNTIIILICYTLCMGTIKAQDKIKISAEKGGILLILSSSQIYNKYGDIIAINLEMLNNTDNGIFVFDYVFGKNLEPISTVESNVIVFEMGGSWQPEFPILPKLRLIKKHGKFNIALKIDSRKLVRNEKFDGNYNVAIQFGYFGFSEKYLYLTKIKENHITVSEGEISAFISKHVSLIVGNIPIVIKK